MTKLSDSQTIDEWHLHGATQANWKYHVRKIFEDTDSLKKIEAGDYLLRIKVQAATEDMGDEMKSMRLGITSTVPVTMK